MKLFRSRSDNYKHYAPIYDAFKGDRHENIQLVQETIAKYNPNAETILELACGTGAILESLAGVYTVAGLDISPSMLRHARKKLPHVQFTPGDMTAFNLNQTFDVIYCLHNSVNHLLGFDQWKALFDSAAKHLSPDGIFLFDINSLAKLDTYATYPYASIQVGEDYMLIRVINDATLPNRFIWHMDIFRKRHGTKSTFTLRRTRVIVDTFSDKQITEGLRKNFVILDTFTLTKAEKAEDIGRTYYVCRKR